MCVPMSTIACYSQKMASEALVWSFRVLLATWRGRWTPNLGPLQEALSSLSRLQRHPQLFLKAVPDCATQASLDLMD